MRRLLYSDFETIAEKYRANIFKNLKKNRPKDNLLDLKKRIPKKGFQKYIDYIDEIITNIDDVNKPEDFLVAKPLEVKTSWEKICSSIPLKPDDFFFKHPVLNPKLIDLKNTLWRGKRNKKPFYEAIVDALRYDYVRDSPNGFVSYFDDLKINACVYCNASYIVNTNVHSLPPKGKISLEVMGRYELDHYLPKSQFPFLCRCKNGFCHRYTYIFQRSPHILPREHLTNHRDEFPIRYTVPHSQFREKNALHC